MVLGGAGMEVVRAVKYFLKPFHSHRSEIKCKKKVFYEKVADEPEADGLSQAVHNLGISWSAESRAGNLVIGQKLNEVFLPGNF